MNSTYSANYDLPWSLYSTLALPPPPRQPEPPNQKPALPKTLAFNTFTNQCLLATLPVSTTSISEYGLTTLTLYRLLTLQSSFAVLASQYDYAKALLHDTLALLTTHPTHFPPNEYGKYQQHALTELGRICSFQNEGDAALAFYEQAVKSTSPHPLATDSLTTTSSSAVTTPTPLLPATAPITLLQYIAAVYLLQNNIPMLVLALEDVERAYLSNVKAIGHALRTPRSHARGKTRALVDPATFYLNSEANADSDVCASFIRDFSNYAAGGRPYNTIASHVQMAHLCVLGPYGVHKTFEFTTDDQFRLGRALQKRGYEESAHTHLTHSSNPFEKNSEAHEVYSRLVLPFVFDSLKSQSLIYSAFEHSLTLLTISERKNNKQSKCSKLVHDFDTLPLVRFASDGRVDELDHLHGLMEEEERGLDSYSAISELFYESCPSLYYVNDVVQTIWKREEENVKPPDRYETFPERNGSTPIRVGVVSSKIYNHETLKLHGGLLEQLTNKALGTDIDFSIACWMTIADKATRRAQEYLTPGMAVNLKHPTQNLEDQYRDYRALEKRNLDVIIYLDLPLDAKSYSMAHRRIAPVQIAIWGHHTYSSQIPDAIDYMLVPEAFAAKGRDSMNLYSEQTILLPGMYLGPELYGAGPKGRLGSVEDSFLSKGGRSEFLDTFMLPEDCNVYVLPCSAPHLSPAYDSVLKDLLRADPNAYVLIGARENVLAEQESPDHVLFMDDVMQHGYPTVWSERMKLRMKKRIAGGKRGGGLWRRVRFLNALESSDYSAVLQAADVVLDTFPHGNLVPSIESLYLGTPVVTLGAAHTKGGGGQVAAIYELIEGVLRKEGAEELQCCDAKDEEEYVDMAVRLATDKEYREKVRGEMMRVTWNEVFDVPDGGEYVKAVRDLLLRVGREAADWRVSGDSEIEDIYKRREDARGVEEEREKKVRDTEEWTMQRPSKEF